MLDEFGKKASNGRDLRRETDFADPVLFFSHEFCDFLRPVRLFSLKDGFFSCTRWCYLFVGAALKMRTSSSSNFSSMALSVGWEILHEVRRLRKVAKAADCYDIFGSCCRFILL